MLRSSRGEPSAIRIVSWIVIVVSVAFSATADWVAPTSIFTIERSTSISADPEGVFAFLSRVDGWMEWLPISDREYTGIRYSVRRGEDPLPNPDGKLSMFPPERLTWSHPDSRGDLYLHSYAENQSMALQLNMGWYHSSHGEVVLEPNATGTRVRWASHYLGMGARSFLETLRVKREVPVFMDAGLANLKALVERGKPPPRPR